MALAALAIPPGALAWSWPSPGPVLAPFVAAPSEYEAGQHRGIDVAGAAGEPALAPAAGTVRFAGTLPRHGRSLTIETADGFSVTLLHLGTLGVSAGVAVAEAEQVGTIGQSGDLEHEAAYVHLGVRRTSEPDGYVDPASLLPPRAAAPPPVPAGGPPPTAAPAPGPVAAAPAPALSPGAALPAVTTAVSRQPVERSAGDSAARPPRAEHRARRRTARPRTEKSTASAPAARHASPLRARAGRPASHAVDARPRTPGPARAPHRRPVPHRLAGAGHQLAAAAPARVRSEPRRTTRSGGDLTRPTVAAAVAAGLAALLAFAWTGGIRRGAEPDDARMMVGDAAPEDPRRSGVALRVGPAPHRPRRGVRGAVRHLRPLPPAEGRRRPHGQRNGRARHARHGRRGQGGALTTRDR